MAFSIWDLMAQSNPQSAVPSPMMESPTAPVGNTPISVKLKGSRMPASVKAESDFDLSFKPAQAAPQSYRDELETAFYKNLSGREANTEGLKTKLAQLEQEKPQGFQAINFAPMLAFADSIAGTRTAHSYQAPTVVKDWEGKKQKLEDAINRENNALSDDQLNYLKSKASEEAMDKRMQMSLASQERAAARLTTNEEDKLRTQYLNHPNYKKMADVSAAYSGLETNMGRTGPEQQALVYQFTKLLDPGSVVRESEYGMSAANAGKIAQAQQYLERLQTGKGLTADQVAMMKDVAKNLVMSSRKSLDSHNALYKDLAMRKGIDPSLVIVDPFYQNQSGQKAPSGVPDFDNMSLEELQKYNAGM